MTLTNLVRVKSVSGAKILTEMQGVAGTIPTLTWHSLVRRAVVAALKDPDATLEPWDRVELERFVLEFPYGPDGEKRPHRHCVRLDDDTNAAMLSAVGASGLDRGTWISLAIKAKIKVEQNGELDATR